MPRLTVGVAISALKLRAPVWRRVVTTALLLIAGATSVLVTASPASAAAYEGECWSNVPLRFTENNALLCSGPYGAYEFYDNNIGSDKTTLHLINCSSNPEIRLERRASTGWVSEGSRIFYCLNGADSGWLEWNDMQSGRYRFLLVDARWENRTWVDIGYYHGAW